MKKIFFILFTIFMFINVAKANEQEKSEWREEKIEGENVETEYRYRFYKEKKIGQYIEPNLVDYYQYEDKNDVIYGPFSGYMASCKEAEHLQIAYSMMYMYKEILPVRFIKILNTSNEEINVKRINIYNKELEIDYTIYSEEDRLFDNIIIEKNNSIILSSSSISLRDIKINLELSDKNIDYELIFSNDSGFTNAGVVAKVKANSNVTEYKYNNNFVLYNNYTDKLIGYDIEIDDLIKVNFKQTMCRIRTIKTFHYNIEKEYYDNNYYKDVNELNISDEEKQHYKKDKEDYKIFYRIKEDNIQENKNENILDSEDIPNDNENEYIDMKEDNDNFSNNIETDGENNTIKNESINDEPKTDNKENKEIKLVKTGVNKEYDYRYLIVYVISLILVVLLIIKYLKKNVD